MKRILLLAAVLLTGCGKDPIQPAKPEASLTGTYELLTGEPLSSLTLTGTATHEGQAVAGAFAWKDGATTYDAAGQYDAPWVFTPADAGKYLPAEGTVRVTVTANLLTVSVTGTYGLLTGEPLSTLTLTGTATHDGQTVEGAFSWKDGATTYKAAGEYDAPWVFTPADAGKYAPAEGTVAVSVDLSVTWKLLTSDFYGLRDFSGSDVSNYGMAMNMLDNGTVEYRMFTRLRNTGATIPVAFVPEENVCAILSSNVIINNSSTVRIDWQQLTPFNGEYVACADTFNTPDNKGKLFRAAYPYFFWDRASRSTFVYRILGVKNASLSAVIQENGKYVFARTSDLENWETGREVPGDFPRDGGFARLPGDNASRPLLLVGGIGETEYLNTVWRSSDGLTWEKTASSQPPFPEGMAGASLAEYGGTLYLIGGTNRAGQPSKSIVCSSDGGVSWQPAGKAMELPAEYSARAYASVFVTPDNTFLIFSGIADFQPVNPPYLFEIWEGRIAGW